MSGKWIAPTPIDEIHKPIAGRVHGKEQEMEKRYAQKHSNTNSSGQTRTLSIVKWRVDVRCTVFSSPTRCIVDASEGNVDSRKKLCHVEMEKANGWARHPQVDHTNDSIEKVIVDIIFINSTTPVENTPIEDHNSGSGLHTDSEENPLDHVIPLELVVFAVEAALGLDDIKFIRVTFKHQIVVVSPTTKIGLAVICCSRQGGIEQMYVKCNKCPVSEKDEEF